MIEILFSGVGWTDIAVTLNRIAVGIFLWVPTVEINITPKRPCNREAPI
jgi:hypothetical protein